MKGLASKARRSRIYIFTFNTYLQPHLYMIHLYFGCLFSFFLLRNACLVYTSKNNISIYSSQKPHLFYTQRSKTERQTQKRTINVTLKTKKKVNVIATSSLSFTHAYTHHKTHIGIEIRGTPLPQSHISQSHTSTLTRTYTQTHRQNHKEKKKKKPKKKKNEKPISISRNRYRNRKRRRWWEFWQVDTVLQQSGAEERAVDAGGG